MSYNVKGEQRNTGRTHFKKGFTPWNKNKKGVYSEEYRRKISEGGKGRTSPMKGVKHSVKTKEKIRQTLLKRNEGRTKKDRSCYQNNIWRELRKLVCKRDGFKCMECGRSSNTRNFLQVHHIDYDVTNNDLSNLITLCNVCHGKINYKREEWIIYYREKLTEVI